MTYIPRHKVTDLIPNKFEAIRVAALEARRLNARARTLDVSLPGLSGFEITRRLKQASPDIAIIILTVHEQAPYPERLLEAVEYRLTILQAGTGYGKRRDFKLKKLGREIVPDLEDVLGESENPVHESENSAQAQAMASLGLDNLPE